VLVALQVAGYSLAEFLVSFARCGECVEYARSRDRSRQNGLIAQQQYALDITLDLWR
jgi:hypothetical protein